jgi:hypothetical protein
VRIASSNDNEIASRKSHWLHKVLDIEPAGSAADDVECRAVANNADTPGRPQFWPEVHSAPETDSMEKGVEQGLAPRVNLAAHACPDSKTIDRAAIHDTTQSWSLLKGRHFLEHSQIQLAFWTTVAVRRDNFKVSASAWTNSKPKRRPWQ